MSNSICTKSDTEEDIARCLSCERPECTNCLVWLPGRKGRAKPKHYRGGNQIMILNGDKFYDMFIAGKSTMQMATALGVSIGLIQSRLRAMGINGDPLDRIVMPKRRFKELPGARQFFKWEGKDG